MQQDYVDFDHGHIYSLENYFCIIIMIFRIIYFYESLDSIFRYHGTEQRHLKIKKNQALGSSGI